MSYDIPLPKIVTYETKDVVSPRWASVFLHRGKYLPVIFRADTREEVISKAETFWSVEMAKNRRTGLVAAVRDTEPKESKENGEAPPAPKKSSRGHHFAGTAWVIHPKTKQAARVKTEEIEAYLKKGYVRGKTLKS